MPLQSKLAFKSPDSLKYKSVPKIENANHVVHTINTSSKMLMWICKSWEEYPENTAAITKHSRVKNACEGCHKQKIKCEDIKPCTRCKNKKLTCEINVPPGSTNNPLSFITSSNDMNLPVDGDPRSPTPDKSPQIVFSSPLRLSTAIKQNLVHTTHGVAPQKPNISANDKRHLLKVYFNRRDPFYPMFSLNYLEDQLKKCENNERSFLSLFFFYALFSRASIFCTQRLQALEEQLLDYAIYLKSLYITTIDPSNMLALVILANHKSHRQLDNDFALVKTLSKEAVEHTKLLIEHYYEQNGTFPPSYYEQYKRSIWWVFIMDRVLHIEQEESFSLEECKVPVDLPEKDIEIDNYYDDDNDVDHTNIMDQWLEGFRFIIIMTKALGRGVNFYRTWIIKKEVTSNYNPYIYTLDNWILTEYLSLKYNPPHLKCIFKDKATTAKLSSTDSTSQTSTSLEGLTENDGLNLIYFLVGFLVLHQPYTVSQYGIGEDISKVSKRGCKAASAMIIKVAIWMGQDSFSSISRSPIVMFALFSSLQLLAQFGIDKDHDKPQSTHSVFDNGLNFATNLPLTTSSKRLQTKLEDIYAKYSAMACGSNPRICKQTKNISRSSCRKPNDSHQDENLPEKAGNKHKNSTSITNLSVFDAKCDKDSRKKQSKRNNTQDKQRKKKLKKPNDQQSSRAVDDGVSSVETPATMPTDSFPLPEYDSERNGNICAVEHDLQCQEIPQPAIIPPIAPSNFYPVHTFAQPPQPPQPPPPLLLLPHQHQYCQGISTLQPLDIVTLRFLDMSIRQLLDMSTLQLLGISIPQLLDMSIPQLLDMSIPQLLDMSTLQPLDMVTLRFLDMSIRQLFDISILQLLDVLTSQLLGKSIIQLLDMLSSQLLYIPTLQLDMLTSQPDMSSPEFLKQEEVSNSPDQPPMDRYTYYNPVNRSPERNSENNDVPENNAPHHIPLFSNQLFSSNMT